VLLPLVSDYYKLEVMHVGNFVYHVRSKGYVILLQKIGAMMCLTAVDVLYCRHLVRYGKHDGQ
jgi:hypothetical protein